MTRETLGNHPEGDRFSKFTNEARSVLLGAQAEAERLGDQYSGVQHILLALTRQDSVEEIFDEMAVSTRYFRRRFHHDDEFKPMETDERVLTPMAKRIIEFSVDVARRESSSIVTTEHMLMAIFRVEGDLNPRLGEVKSFELLKQSGISREKVLEARNQMKLRGN